MHQMLIKQSTSLYYVIVNAFRWKNRCHECFALACRSLLSSFNWYYSTLTVLAVRLNEFSLPLKAKVETHVKLVIFPSLYVYVMHNALFCYVRKSRIENENNKLEIEYFDICAKKGLESCWTLEPNDCLLQVRSARWKQLMSINNLPKCYTRNATYNLFVMNRELSSMHEFWFEIFLISLNR
jgi:hypothetical protein